MFAKLLDSPLQLLILVLVIVLVFGATRLPNAARQVGRSMRIFKSEMKEMKTDGDDADGTPKQSSQTTAGNADARDAVHEDNAPRVSDPGGSSPTR